MDPDTDNQSDGSSPGDNPRGRWVTIHRDGSYVHVFVGARGTVTRGPAPLLGLPYSLLITPADEGWRTIHPKGQRPAAYAAHPLYRQPRDAEPLLRPAEDASSALEQAFATAPIPPWVRSMRRDLIAQSRSLLQRGETDLAFGVSGAVDGPALETIRRQLAALPTLYRTLWRAAGYRCEIVGRNVTGLPEVAERERQRGTPGIFVPTRQTVYIFAQFSPTDFDRRTALLEELGHGLDLLIGVLHGQDGPRAGRIPLETVARSNQADFLALWTTNAHNARIDRYYRRSASELFAWTFTDYQYGSGILKREHPRLFRFMVDLESEVALHVGP